MSQCFDNFQFSSFNSKPNKILFFNFICYSPWETAISKVIHHILITRTHEFVRQNVQEIGASQLC